MSEEQLSESPLTPDTNSEQLKTLWEAIQQDPTLQEKFKSATDAASLISIANQEGFEITAEDFKGSCVPGGLSDEELEGVSGGDACCICGCFGPFCTWS